MKKLTVNVLKEMVRKALVSEQGLAVPPPANPIQAPPAPDDNNLLANAQKMLADNEALRAEIKAEMDANPQDARLLKMALQDIAQAILGNKEVIATLAKKQTGGQVVEEGYDEETGKVEELWLTIENDGEVSDPEQRVGNRLGRKYDAVLNNLKKHAAKGRYDRTAAIKGWMYFVNDYAQQYAADYLDSPEGKWLSKSERLEIASRLEEKERNNVTGEGEWEKPKAGDFSSDVTFEEQAGAAPALAVETTKEQAYAAPSVVREQPLDQEPFPGLDADDVSDLEWEDQDMAYGDESHWADVLPDDFDVPSSGPGWTLSPDEDQSWIPELDPESGEDTSWVNDTVPEPGQELPKQMGMGKAAKLRAEGRGSAWSRMHARDPEDATSDLYSPEYDTEEEYRRERHRDSEEHELDAEDFTQPVKLRKEQPGDDDLCEKCLSEALEWVRNDDPDKVAIYEAWVQREAREASRRGGLMDDAQYQEIAEEFISDMTDKNLEYQQMLKEERTDTAGMTRVESKVFAGMDKVALGKKIVEKLG